MKRQGGPEGKSDESDADDEGLERERDAVIPSHLLTAVAPERG
jgi:hypothetical protein